MMDDMPKYIVLYRFIVKYIAKASLFLLVYGRIIVLIHYI
jgi:hypothetical protein